MKLLSTAVVILATTSLAAAAMGPDPARRSPEANAIWAVSRLSLSWLTAQTWRALPSIRRRWSFAATKGNEVFKLAATGSTMTCAIEVYANTTGATSSRDYAENNRRHIKTALPLELLTDIFETNVVMTLPDMVGHTHRLMRKWM